MLVLTMMVLKLLSMLDLMLGTIDKNNARYVKKNKQRINIICSMALNKMVGLVHIRKWKNK